MSASIDGALVDRVRDIMADIAATEAAREPIEVEVQREAERLDALATKAEATGQWWSSPSPTFTPSTFNDAVTSALMLIEPAKTKATLLGLVKRKAELWQGARMTADAKARKLDKLSADLRRSRAQLELQRRQVEASTNEMQPRTGPVDCPSVWLLQDQALAELASNGRGR